MPAGARPNLAAAAVVLSAAACNAIFGIEEGVLVDGQDQGAGAGGTSELENGGASQESPPGAGGRGAADSSSGGSASELARGGSTSEPAQGGSAGAAGAMPVESDLPALPANVRLDDAPLTFGGVVATHPSAIFEGALSTYRSELGTTITPDCALDPECFAGQAGSEVCVTGTTAAVPNDDFDRYFGAGLLIALEKDYLDPPVPPWDRAQGRVRGFSFTITGTEIDQLSFNVGVPARPDQPFPSFGVALTRGSGARYDILFEWLLDPRWDPANATLLPEATALRNLSWEVGALAKRAQSFSLCVSDIRPIWRAE